MWYKSLDIDIEKCEWHIRDDDHQSRSSIDGPVQELLRKISPARVSPSELIDVIEKRPDMWSGGKVPNRSTLHKSLDRLRTRGMAGKEDAGYFYTEEPQYVQKTIEQMYKRYPSPTDLADEAMPGDDVRHVAFA